ncbi:MAG: cell division protein ZapE [Gammaproteobacteria bacterium PRO9]|nr:cell division protein ZapE [Gammaproteobacteria bacterium PRO9]
MSLLALYQAHVAEQTLNEDPAQLRAIAVLERVATELAARPPARRRQRLLRRILPHVAARSRPPVRGAYLWGGVGRGKTLLMDLFHESLPFADKRRFHFHHIMSLVKGRLAGLHDIQDPMAVITDELADETRVICFDEFFVSDIADAMLLGRFIAGLVRRGVTLVATSNIAPRDLYRGGLQRQQFLPAIDLLEQHTEVVHLDGLTDYRLRVLESAYIWQVPPGPAADANLERYFRRMARGAGDNTTHLDVLGRRIPVRQHAEGVVWFDFAALCDGPRSAEDYIEIARSYQTVLVSGIPLLDETRENAARRFIALVDELYDRRVNLVASAALPIARIYAGTRLRPEFERTRSRLLEMQSMEYLAASHLQ